MQQGPFSSPGVFAPYPFHIKPLAAGREKSVLLRSNTNVLYGNNYLDMVCYDLNDVFTAELAENAENKRFFVMPLRILPLRTLRARA